MGARIARLSSRAARDQARYGGKGAGLARLAALGLDVPAGFCLPTAAFTDYIASLANPSRQPSADAVASGTLPEVWRKRLAAAFRELGGPVAVRSSLVGEDAAHASLAGQLESVLGVTDEAALFAAVRRCYASAYAPRLRHYRTGLQRRRGSAAAVHTPPAMALVIQRMQAARSGGVAFSADPSTGRRCVIVEATSGPVDGVVRGVVAPARWVVDARGELVEDGREEGRAPPLEAASILVLAGAVRRIAAAYGHAVDVEWLHDGGRFWFLQARPVTTLVGKHVYSNRLVADMSPGLIKPLLWSTNTQAITRNVFGRLFGELIGRDDIDCSQLVRRIHSRLYADETRLGELMVRVGLPANFFEMMARDERGERPRVPVSRWPRLWRFVPFVWRHSRVRRPLRRFLRDHDASLETYRRADWAAADDGTLQDAGERLLALHGRAQWFVFLAAFNLMLRRRLLERCIRAHAPRVQARELLQGNSRLKALEPNEMLQIAGALARDLPSAERALLDGEDDKVIRSGLADSSAGRELLATVDAFLRRYGFLSANGTDFSTTSWIEMPQLIWRSVARHAGNGADDTTRDPRAEHRATREDVERRLPPLRRFIFRRLLAATRSYLDLRERTSLLFSEDNYQFRRVVLAMGERLAARGDLCGVDDVFYLFKAELWGLLTGEFAPDAARRLVAARRAEIAADAACEPEATLCGEMHELTAPVVNREAAHLVGIGGSPGTLEGYARVVRDPMQAPADLGAKDILVVPFTDVGWTPLLSGIGGIVAEAGGQLSHTAIIAREYGVPAVVSVRGAMQQFKDGEAITLDGRRGRVYRGHVLTREGSPV